MSFLNIVVDLISLISYAVALGRRRESESLSLTIYMDMSFYINYYSTSSYIVLSVHSVCPLQAVAHRAGHYIETCQMV